MAQSAWVKVTWVRCILHGWIVTSLVASPSSHVTSSCPILTRNKPLHPNLVYLKLKHIWELWIQLSTVQLSTIYCPWSSVHDLLSTIWLSMIQLQQWIIGFSWWTLSWSWTNFFTLVLFSSSFQHSPSSLTIGDPWVSLELRVLASLKKSVKNLMG